jgi:hypothetical protein
MKVRRWLLDKSCTALLFLFRMIGVHAQMRLKISLGNSKGPYSSERAKRRSRNLELHSRRSLQRAFPNQRRCWRFFWSDLLSGSHPGRDVVCGYSAT